MKITPESLKWPQIDMGMRYLIENKFVYCAGEPHSYTPLGIIEFGVGSGRSLKKISEYVKNNDLDVQLMGYDSWDGLPPEKDGIELFPKYIEGAYKYNYPSIAASNNIFLRKCTFDKIPDQDANMIKAAIFIHIDSDIYISAYQALDWCFRNKLVVEHTLIAFDEYRTQFSPLAGEELAFYEIVQRKYKAKVNEIFHYIYKDKDLGNEIRQNVFEIVGFNN